MLNEANQFKLQKLQYEFLSHIFFVLPTYTQMNTQMKGLICFFLFSLVICAMETVYVTKSYTYLETRKTTETKLITQWSTILHTPPPMPVDETITLTTTSTLTTHTTLDNFTSEMLEAHNEKRRMHQSTPDLVWSNSIAQSAQRYADEYNCNGILIHSRNPLYGENIALGFNTTAALRAWYAEIKYYSYDNPVFSENTGHFTQVIWRNTSQVGCGRKYCDTYYGQYTICQYSMPGNYAGQFDSNVMELL